MQSDHYGIKPFFADTFVHIANQKSQDAHGEIDTYSYKDLTARDRFWKEKKLRILSVPVQMSAMMELPADTDNKLG